MLKNIKSCSLLLYFFIAITSSSICFALVNNDQQHFDVTYYEINITINPQSEIIDGFVIVQAISLIDNLSHITLDLYNNMIVTSLAGNASSYTHESNLLQVNLDRSYSQNEQIAVTIFYNGHPASGTNFNPMVFDRSRGVVTISSESCPYYARCWWPCKDRPDDKPDSMDIKITVSSDLTVASNGALVEVKNNSDGTKTYHWQARNPIATYLVSFTISNYNLIEDHYVNANQDTLAIMHFIYPEHTNLALIDFNNLNEMLQILELYYGKYPYYNEKYGVAEYVGYWGGMEYQTLSSVQPYYIRGNHDYDDLFVHELAHQWWGDCITPKDFHHSWVSEGFATFTEALYFGQLEDEERYHSYMNNENNALNYKGIMYRHDITDPDIVYAPIVYYKGAWFLHMLRHVIGEENFWTGLREYRSQFEYGSATTEDLQHAFEKVIGDSLGWFFHQWVYEPNFPQYNYGWWQRDLGDGHYQLTAFIDQIQLGAPLFKMPVDLTIVTAATETTLVVTVEDSTEMIEYISPEAITTIQLDKDNWILKQSEIIITPLLKYFAHQIIDSSANNNGLAEPGETVDLLVTIINKGVLTEDLTVKLSCPDPSIQLPSEIVEVSFPGVNYGHSAKDLVIPFSFSVTPGAIGHITVFQLQFLADNNYSDIDSFDVKIGSPNVLLVDDDNGADYEQYFNQPMLLSKIYSAGWEIQSQGVPSFAEVLQSYQTVIWFTGDDRTTALTHEEQQAIAEYLDHGGWLVLTGQDIGHDLIADGTPEDSAFFKNYLHADLVADTVNLMMIRGEAGDPIGNGLFIYLQETPGSAGNQKSPSAITPRDDASSFLKYIPQNSTAAIRYMDTNKGYRLVYLAFGFEGISGPYQDSAQKLLTRILSWLSGSTEVEQLKFNHVPKKYFLEQNYPNPFNTTTKIRYHLPKTDQVKLSIFNLRGQQIKTLIEKLQPAGIYELMWDGRDNSGFPVASGIYVCRMVTRSFMGSKKLVLVK